MADAVLASLENRSVSEISDSETVPTLTVEHRNAVLLLQRQILTLQVNIYNAQKQLEQLGPALSDTLNRLATELKIDTNKWSFNLDSISFVPKV